MAQDNTGVIRGLSSVSRCSSPGDVGFSEMVKLVFVALLLLVVSCFGKVTKDKIGSLAKTLETAGNGRQVGGCPLCDSSVYSYCPYKMAHDACCCGGQYGPAIPPGCQYTDCQILYAKSCFEHHLIRRCCCENPYQ